MEDPITADWPSRVPIEEDEEEAESLIEQYAVQPELALDVRSQHRTLGIFSLLGARDRATIMPTWTPCLLRRCSKARLPR